MRTTEAPKEVYIPLSPIKRWGKKAVLGYETAEDSANGEKTEVGVYHLVRRVEVERVTLPSVVIHPIKGSWSKVPTTLRSPIINKVVTNARHGGRKCQNCKGRIPRALTLNAKFCSAKCCNIAYRAVRAVAYRQKHPEAPLATA